MIRHLAVQVETWPDLQRELLELRARSTLLAEQLGSATAAYEALVDERELWAEQARSLEASEAEVARLRSSGAAPSGEESRRAAALEARNRLLDSEVAALRLKAEELEES